MTTIYLVRHAEAEGNLYRIAHGHYNSCITDDRGCRQIRALAERFRDVPHHSPVHLSAQGAAAASGSRLPGDLHGGVGGALLV